MAKATGLAIFTDVQEVADLVLEHNGGNYECETYGQAVHFVQRFYKFRVKYRKIYGEPCPYDKFIAGKISEGETTVRFRLRQHVGTFTPADRKSASLTTGEELFDIAEQIAKNITGVD